VFVLVAGAGVGVLTGGLLGAAQAATFPRGARRSAWVAANLAGWAVAMALVMVGAGTPSAGWPPGTVLAWAALTGATAGALLGACLGWFAPSLTGPPVHNRVALAVLRRSPHRAGRALLGLRVTGRRTGRVVELPVMYAEQAGVLWVAVGHTAAKTWWRNLGARPCVQVLHSGRWSGFTARVLRRGEPGYAAGLAVYAARWPRARLADEDVLVRLEPVTAAVPHT
jgi:deazaflavin-dependent oxidoreductase (nitroreductase family)